MSIPAHIPPPYPHTHEVLCPSTHSFPKHCTVPGPGWDQNWVSRIPPNSVTCISGTALLDIIIAASQYLCQQAAGVGR